MSIMNNQRESPKLSGKTEEELDWINTLPGHVIDQILSLLPIRDAVRTCVLSRKWRYQWATVPCIVFDNRCLSASYRDQTFIKNKLVNIIDHVLLLHKGPMNKFKLSHLDLLGVTDIDRWILYISRSSIKEFILYIWKGQPYKPPSCLFNCHNLINLELFNCLLKPPLTFLGFKNLRSLYLWSVTIIQDEFEKLISSCPLLKRLGWMNFTGVKHLTIDAPNLQFFDICGIFDDISFRNTVHLALVSIGLDANVDDENDAPRTSSKLLRFFVNLPHIRRLEIKDFFFKYLAIGDVPSRLPNPCFDLNYLSICIDFDDLEENITALCLLRSCPNLQVLDMGARGVTRRGRSTRFCEEDDHWSSLFSRLRLVKVSGIYGVKLEMDLIKFLLSNSPVLEKLTVEPATQVGSKWELMKDLLRFRRASMFAEVIYLDP